MKPLRPPKSAKNGKKQTFQPGFCVQKTNDLINIEINQEEKFKAKKYITTNSSSDSYDNIHEIDRRHFDRLNSARGSQKSFRGDTQKIEFNKALEGLFGV
jgi:hypothetical protein